MPCLEENENKLIINEVIDGASADINELFEIEYKGWMYRETFRSTCITQYSKILPAAEGVLYFAKNSHP